jgi:hypothetical protein
LALLEVEGWFIGNTSSSVFFSHGITLQEPGKTPYRVSEFTFAGFRFDVE